MDEISITAHLPGLDIEVSRATLPDQPAEAIVIRLKATPSFEAVGQWLTQPTILAGQSLALWSQMLQAFWQPWLSLLPPTRMDR